ncbi:MAG: sigma-54 dependent transcriptional regulator [Candidatus Competibacteraceae bacterium]|nr:sigma-54 dependent transcriptional regulator [Candidatus Competibacteraceae bacterium]
METCSALIVDDEADIRELIELTLTPMGVICHGAATLREARALLQRQSFSLCITDMRLPDGSGLELVAHIQHTRPQLPVAVITAHGNVESAVEALKLGAFDFVSKPVDISVLRNLITTALRMARPPQHPESRPTLLGQSTAMERVRGLIRKLARSQAPVFISGESGTGKELAARMIHGAGPRADKPFVPVNCGAIPEQLMESEFFGHKKGSFTGAAQDKAGLFQSADGGTLFLDEVAELPPAMQVKLLRAIQERAVRPVGAVKEEWVDVRVLSASHRELGEMVRNGTFRQDLFYRLNVIELHLPPLRERCGDIPELAERLLERLSRDFSQEVPRLSPRALAALKHYGFPGNVRELENILERALTLCEGEVIDEEDLLLPEDGMTGAAAPEGHHPPPPEDDTKLESYLEEREKEIILQALEATRYNKTAAAEKLGITFRALRYRLKKLGLD